MISQFRKIPTLKVDSIEKYIKLEVIKGGMISKTRAIKDLVENGVEKVSIVSGNVPHRILLELLTDEGVGTQFLK